MMFRYITKIKKVIILCLLSIIPSYLHGQDKDPTYYNLLRSDKSSLSLFELSSIAGHGSNTTFIIVDIFRGSTKTGMINTWKADCNNGTMKIVKSMVFSPGYNSKAITTNSETVKRDSTPVSHLAYEIACTGMSNLQMSRIYYDDLPVIIKQFWN